MNTYVITASMLAAFMRCSGPGAMQHIHHNVVLAKWLFVVTAGLALCSFALVSVTDTGRQIRQVLVGMVALNPLWLVSAYSGDCGMLLVQVSTMYAGSAGILVLLQLGYILLAWCVGKSRVEPFGSDLA